MYLMGIKQLSKGVSVGRFFAQANWQGLKKAMEVVEPSMVAQNPVMAKKSITQPQQELNLDDLSDLF